MRPSPFSMARLTLTVRSVPLRLHTTPSCHVPIVAGADSIKVSTTLQISERSKVSDSFRCSRVYAGRSGAVSLWEMRSVRACRLHEQGRWSSDRGKYPCSMVSISSRYQTLDHQQTGIPFLEITCPFRSLSFDVEESTVPHLANRTKFSRNRLYPPMFRRYKARGRCLDNSRKLNKATRET